MSDGIQRKVVVITGASSGLGESTARHLAKLGATVILGARRKDRLDAIMKDIEASGDGGCQCSGRAPVSTSPAMRPLRCRGTKPGQ